MNERYAVSLPQWIFAEIYPILTSVRGTLLTCDIDKTGVLMRNNLSWSAGTF